MKIGNKVKHRGIKFEFGDDNIIIPSLNVLGMEEATPFLNSHDKVMRDIKGQAAPDFSLINQRYESISQIVLIAAKRNYPDATLEDMKDFINGANADGLLAAALGMDRQSAKVKDLGEDAPVGN